MTIPETMQAIEIAQPGGPEVLRLAERPVPRPGPGEVLVKVAAAGINRPDVLQRMGLYPPPPGASDIPGLEVAGQIVAAGEGAEQAVGGEVCALVAGGGYAEYCVAPAGTCLPVPDALSLIEAAAGINRPDVLQRMGLYPPPPGASDIPGLEVAGLVVAAGEGAEQAVGGEVCALVAGGGYAEYCVAPAGTCLPVPDAMSLIEAAAMPETLFTVWVNLFERGFAADGDTVLVHGGTSGIGTMAIALGKLFGLRVIVTCGTDAKCAAAVKLGAAHAINYRTQDFVAEVKRFTGNGVDVVLDMVGGDYVHRNLACLGDDGRHVSIAFQRGDTAEIPIPHIMRRRLTLTGSTLRPRPIEFKAMVADEIARTVWRYAEGGRLKPVIDSKFPLAKAADAHARMESGDHIGKIVLEVG